MSQNHESKPNVLITVGYYLPGFKGGGPIRSIENLVAALGEEFQFRIVTTDRDLGDPVPYPGIVRNQWVRVGASEVMYTRPGLRGVLQMCALLFSVDRNTVLHVNSYFSRRFSMLPILLRWLGLCRPRKVVLAPCGEFGAGALLIKPTRKQLYLRLSRVLGLHRGIIWLASSDLDAVAIRRQYPEAIQLDARTAASQLTGSGWRRSPGMSAIALDFASTERPARRNRMRKQPGELRAVFISRISREKNLLGALKLLEGISGNISYNIYGPLEDMDYWKECQKVIAALAANVHVQYCGQVKHEEVKEIFSEHDLFLFPTTGENFGHVIAESLISGCPVLISDQTPWQNLAADEAGWDIPLDDVPQFCSALRQCIDGDEAWRARVSSGAINLALRQVARHRSTHALRELFR